MPGPHGVALLIVTLKKGMPVIDAGTPMDDVVEILA